MLNLEKYYPKRLKKNLVFFSLTFYLALFNFNDIFAGCPIPASQAGQSNAAPPRILNNRLNPVQPAVGGQDPCFPSPCGSGAQCRSTGNRAVSLVWSGVVVLFIKLH